jgi:hypothetical protein
VATTIDLAPGASSGAFGGSVSVSATLATGAGGAIANRPILFRIGTSLVSASTNASGVATATLPLTTNPGQQQIVATFGGDDTHAPSSDVAAFRVDPAGTNLTLTIGGNVALGASTSGISAVLRSGSTPLPGQTIFFVVSADPSGIAAGNGLVKGVTTDAAGKGSLGTFPVLPVGPYTVTVYYNGTIPLNPWAPLASRTSITLTNPIYNPATPVSGTLNIIWAFAGFFSPVDNLPTLNTATAGQTIPVKFSLGGNQGLSIFRTGYPRAVPIACPGSSTPVDTIEETVSTSGLQYDATTNRYQYNWKTVKSTMAGKCWQLQLGLKDGNTVPVANFKLK